MIHESMYDKYTFVHPVARDRGGFNRFPLVSVEGSIEFTISREHAETCGGAEMRDGKAPVDLRRVFSLNETQTQTRTRAGRNRVRVEL